MSNTWKGLLKDLFTLAILIVVVVIPIRLFVISPFVVDGESMHPTFENLNYLIVDELVYDFHAPARGDVIVFRYPGDPSIFYIKRIIGLPGETVAINNGVVSITTPAGTMFTLNEPYVVNEDVTYNKSVTLTGGEYFVMGDNRPNSSDSRVWGPLPAKNIIGRVDLRLLPLSDAGFFPRRGFLCDYSDRDDHYPMIRETIPAEELLNKARAVGQYYGFTPLEVLTAAARGVPRAKAGYPDTIDALELDTTAEAVASFLKHFQNTLQAPTQRQPLFIWHTNIAAGRPAQKKALIQFHALGSDHAIAEAVIIRAIMSLTRDLFREEPVLYINSMGDKETRARYARELSNFFRKRSETLPEECIARAKQDVFGAAELVIARECAEELPAPTEHLSDASRKRFEDLLEYLEMTETPFELARTLISRGSIWNDTCFEIRVADKRVAWGSRYNDLVRHFFPTAAFSAVGAVFQIPSEGMVKVKSKPSRLRFSFVHIGDEAKRVSIRLAEEFRHARVSLAQDIGVESLTEQMSLAERRGSPYLLIMGRKEALEGSAILRNRKTQEQTILPLKGLAERLKAFA